MIIIVGLGNPGKKYQNTRHNIGFLVADEFKKKSNFPDFKTSKRFSSLVSEGVFDNEKIILAKPQTFMNKSGGAVKAIESRIRDQELRIIIVHDDIDLTLGNIKIIQNRGSAGHKGVESIIKSLGTKNFVRLRVGIKPEQSRALNHGTERFVLRQFIKGEGKIVKEVVKKSVLALEIFIKDGLEKAMNEFNQ